MVETKGSSLRILTCPWFTLCHPHVPLGIEVTVALVRALVQENTEKKKLVSGELESMFCMALVRFVNLITDVSQVPNFTASINSIAEKMGVPEWIVDLRHATTHSNVPSLNILTVAATWCLEWIKLNYWAVEDTFLTDVNKLPSAYTSEQVRRAFFDVRSKLLTIAKESTNVEKAVAKNRLSEILKTIVRSGFTSRELVQMLVVNGLLFPESQATHPSEFRSDPSLAMHQFKLWRPVLKFLQQMDGLLHLIEALIVEMNRRPTTRGTFCIIWITLINDKFHVMDKLRNKDWNVYFKLMGLLLKTKSKRIPQVTSHLSKERKEKLAKVTRNASRVVGPIAVNLPSKPISPNSPRMPMDCLVVTCPLGILPTQRGSTRLHLDLPDHVDLICDRSVLDVSIDKSNTNHLGYSQLDTPAWLL